MPIDHFVILMMENRSFDHYFGWLDPLESPTRASTRPTPTPSGKQWQTRHAAEVSATQAQ